MDDETPKPSAQTGGLADPKAPWEEVVEDPSAPRAMLAVLFTDIIGSTELASALGDKRWRELLEQHDAAIRTQIERFGGREVDTAGDAFFATFGLAVRAVDCALESARAVRRLGLRIRAGVHMGECVVSDNKVRGVTVHIGARVGAKAKGDEVLVSSTVRDILAGAGLRFVDRGEQTLKGVEGRWRLHAVEPRERDNEADLPPLLESEIAKPPEPFWKRRRTVVAAITAFVLAAAAVTFAVARGGGLSSVTADSIAAIDASSGKVIKEIRVRRRPVGLVAARGGLWVTNSIDRSVSQVKGEGASVETIPVGAGPIDVAGGNNLIWVANADAKSVSRVSPDTGSVVGDPIEAGNGLSDIGFGAGSVWITNAVDGTVWRIDPGTGDRTAEITVGPALRGIAVTDDQIWATSETAGTVTRLDPRSGVITSVVRVGNGPGAVAIGPRDVWVANAFDGTVSRVDPSSGSVRSVVRVGRGPRAIAIAKGHVFVANEIDGTVSMIEQDNKVSTIKLQNAPMGLTVAGDRVWVSVRGGISTYRGGTLRYVVASPFGRADTVDPNFNYPLLGLAIGSAAYDGLTSFKKVGGVEGSEIAADLAEAIRPPTDGGTTYSFTLRRGLRYSDGTEVKAADVRQTFERIMSNDTDALVFMPPLVGADKCEPKKPCDLSSGVITDDRARTVVLKLRNPFADTLYSLAHPLLSIVPPSAPPTDAGLTPIPGTGPYRIESAKGNEEAGEAILTRNLHFTPRGLAAPDGYADRIEMRWGGSGVQNVDAAKAGRVDVTIDAAELQDAELRRLFNEVPAQVHVYDTPSIAFVTLNTHAAPFNDIRVRRAVNLAVDRKAMAAEIGFLTELSCQTLNKNVLGYVPYCPFTKSPNPSGIWVGPDLDTAKRLVTESGTADQRVTVWVDAEGGLRGTTQRRVGPHVVRALREIGYDASLQPLSSGDYYEMLLRPDSRHQVSLNGWFTDFPVASSFVVPLRVCPDTYAQVTGAPGDAAFNVSRFCSKDIDAKVKEALVPGEDLASTSRKWAEIDRLLTDQATWIPIAVFRGVGMTSPRIGNFQANAFYGPLITQMWVVEAPRPSPS